MPYSLRCTIFAHGNDVRAIATMDNCIISGSLDKSVKLWTETGLYYEEITEVSCHAKYVSAVCAIPPCDLYPIGLIFSGGHDKKILGFPMYTVEPTITLEGHSGPVCCITTSEKKGHLLSSSWDGTAKMWDIASGRCVTTFFGHSETVWCVLSMPEDFVVTASGDKSVKVFLLDGSCVNTLQGHTDCVRGLSRFDNEVFLSCGNDGTIRKWNVKSGQNLESLMFHDSYLYSIATQGPLVAFCGEDNLLGVWVDGTSVSQKEVLKHPATSVWAVAILPNSDIVTGSSDGYIRIFTQEPSRMASKEKIDEYEKEFVKKSNGEGTSSVNSSDLPGKEALANDGLFDGEIKLIHDNGTNYAYSWSEKNKTWNILGEEVRPKEPKSKPLHEGKEYDYVFSVDIEDSQEPLKLPYNKGDDPTLVAQKFIIRNNLNPDFLDRIVSFLAENTGQETSNVPSTSSSKQEGFVFESRSYYPPKKHVTFDMYDLKLICKKLTDFMLIMNYTEKDAVSIKTILQDLVKGKIVYEGDSCPCIEILVNSMSQWPEAYVYPVLDITRIISRSPDVHPVIFNGANAAKMLSALERFMSADALLNNKMFLFRIFSNMFSQKAGENLLFDNKEALLRRLPDLITDQHKGLQIAVSTFILNMSLTALNKKDFVAAKLCGEFIQKICDKICDPEATFRMLVALGTIALIEGSALISDNILKVLNVASSWKKENPDCKAAKCADCIIADFVPKSV